MDNAPNAARLVPGNQGIGERHGDKLAATGSQLINEGEGASRVVLGDEIADVDQIGPRFGLRRPVSLGQSPRHIAIARAQFVEDLIGVIYTAGVRVCDTLR